MRDEFAAEAAPALSNHIGEIYPRKIMTCGSRICL